MTKQEDKHFKNLKFEVKDVICKKQNSKRKTASYEVNNHWVLSGHMDLNPYQHRS